ncbi:MAG: carboxypeptidase regulatory-like domain-containing protein, partial [Saprospiraceae bacterium]
FIFQPTYRHAAWLQGKVTDAATGQLLDHAKVFVLLTSNADTTKTTGLYKTGADSSGTYAVQVLREGYLTKTIPNVTLTSGQITQLDVALSAAVLATDQPADDGMARVWPTLFSDRLTVELAIGSGYTRAQLLDVQGQVLVTSRLSGASTDISLPATLPQAVYVLRLLGEQGRTRSFTVIKE